MKGDSLGATGLGLCPKLLKFSSCGPKIAVKDFVAEVPTEFKRRLFIGGKGSSKVLANQGLDPHEELIVSN
jgi:hypothetical protein